MFASTKRDLERLCRTYGLATSGHKSDLAARLLEYIDGHGADRPSTEAD